ncbi:hypothetical protein ABZ721_36385 [Streptomyces sp. NPDC006733]|uniref:hypothetical protein n=1 Tax=Streptomyces sp. NPDC006733 TaxID=3155460 RepID=UPI0033FC7C22
MLHHAAHAIGPRTVPTGGERDVGDYFDRPTRPLSAVPHRRASPVGAAQEADG